MEMLMYFSLAKLISYKFLLFFTKICTSFPEELLKYITPQPSQSP